jgi:hypothetical protein
MERVQEASRCRQRIADGLARLAHLIEGVQGRADMVRASLYRYRRRCGSQRCRCRRGELHGGRALSVSDGRRSHTVPLTGLDLAGVARQVDTYRQWREARAKIVRSFGEVLQAVDELGRLRTVSVERLRHARVRRR